MQKISFVEVFSPFFIVVSMQKQMFKQIQSHQKYTFHCDLTSVSIYNSFAYRVTFIFHLFDSSEMLRLIVTKTIFYESNIHCDVLQVIEVPRDMQHVACCLFHCMTHLLFQYINQNLFVFKQNVI